MISILPIYECAPENITCDFNASYTIQVDSSEGLWGNSSKAYAKTIGKTNDPRKSLLYSVSMKYG